MRQEPVQLNKWDDIIAIVVGIVALMIYGRTVTPGLLPGDGGEFQTLTYLLGSTHPTGYPVYLILSRLFAFLPLGELAFRVNLFSAVMGAVAVAGVYLCGRLLSGYRWTAVAVAIALALSPTLWSQALIAEVYTAGAAFIVLILLALLWWDKTESKRALFLAGLLGGLSLGVHMSVALLAPAILLFLLLHWRRGWKMWKTAVLGGVVGLAVTVALFWLIDQNNAPANYFNSVVGPSRSAWGLAGDEIDGPVERLLYGWQARQFRSFMFANMGEVMPQQAGEYWANLPNELAWPIILLTILGALKLLVWWPHAAMLLLVSLAAQLIYFFNYEIWDLYVFFIPTYVLMALFACAGLGTLADGILALWGRQFSSSAVSKAAVDFILAVIIFVFAVWPIFIPRQEAFIAGEAPFEFDEYPVYDENLSLIASATVIDLPEGAIVFTDWDMVWPFYFTAHIENGRTDLTFIETQPADDQDNIAESIIDYVAINLDAHPIYFSERQSMLLEAGYTFSPARIGPTRMFRVVKDE